MSFKGKVVLVTGASSGIGAATAVLFCKEGANVAIVARNETKLKNAFDKCAKVGHKPLLIKADVAKDEDAKRIVKDTIAKFGKLDVLINNAGIVRLGGVLDGKIMEIYDEIVNINLRAVVQITTLAAPYLVQTKGNIVNISSISGSAVGDWRFGAYCVSKAGLDHFSRAVALELSPCGVRVNIVSPGPVKTDILDNTDMNFDGVEVKTLLNRISESEEIAELIAYVASDKAKGITGSNFVTDNGMLLK